MAIRRCPRCELNYTRPGEEFCSVCMSEMKSRKKEVEEQLDICPECNENMVVPGQELCKLCLLERRRVEMAEKPKDEDVDTIAASLNDTRLPNMEEIPLDDEEMDELGEELGISADDFEDTDDESSDYDEPMEISLDEYRSMEESSDEDEEEV